MSLLLDSHIYFISALGAKLTMDIVRSATFSSRTAYQPISDQKIQRDTIDQQQTDDKENVKMHDVRYSKLKKQLFDSQDQVSSSVQAINFCG
jgi:hypothetical protein